MGNKTLIVATFCLVMLSCGKSDESAQVTNTGREVPDTQVTTVSEAPATAETMKVAEETVAISQPVAQAHQQTEAAGGEAVNKKACISCHMTGAGGAPKLGDVSAWEPRIAKGASALVQSAITGVPGTAMMAKGACGTCSDEDIKAAVDYMIAQVG